MDKLANTLRVNEQTPRQIVDELDKYIVGQSEAKRSVAIALRSDKLNDANLPAATKTIYAWEAGRTQPDADRLLYLCKLYEIDDILTAFGYLPQDSEPIHVTAFEKRLIQSYREHPEIQSAVNKLLELD